MTSIQTLGSRTNYLKDTKFHYNLNKVEEIFLLIISTKIDDKN